MFRDLVARQFRRIWPRIETLPFPESSPFSPAVLGLCGNGIVALATKTSEEHVRQQGLPADLSIPVLLRLLDNGTAELVHAN